MGAIDCWLLVRGRVQAEVTVECVDVWCADCNLESSGGGVKICFSSKLLLPRLFFGTASEGNIRGSIKDGRFLAVFFKAENDRERIFVNPGFVWYQIFSGSTFKEEARLFSWSFWRCFSESMCWVNKSKLWNSCLHSWQLCLVLRNKFKYIT